MSNPLQVVSAVSIVMDGLHGRWWLMLSIQSAARKMSPELLFRIIIREATNRPSLARRAGQLVDVLAAQRPTVLGVAVDD